MYKEDNKCNGNCFCDCLNRFKELTKDRSSDIETYKDEKPLLTERLRMEVKDFWEKVESGGFEYQDEDMNIAKEIAMLHPNIRFGGKCASQGDCSFIEYVPVKIKDLKMWRCEWLEENDPQDGTDCVTPFDKYFY